jgi:sugar phosphate isomerase/epimerase
MSAALKDLGIQSWCYREFKTIPSFITELKKAGVAATEVCGVQVDFSKEEAFPSVVKQFNDAGVKILSIGVQGMHNNPAVEEKYFKFCKEAGAKYMSVSFAPNGMWDAFRTAEKLADKYDMYLGIHNHGGYDWLGNGTMLEYIFKNTSKRIGLTLDTAWALDAKQDPIQWAEKFKDRLYGLHIKDFVFDKARNPEDVIVGTGNLKLKEFMATVKKNGFHGFTVLEYEADAHDPAPKLAKCVEALKVATA